MKPKISAFAWVPPFAQGLVRDLRVRWALQEAGRDYEELLIGPQDQSSREYRRLQPFGQVPAYQDELVALFETGAIVLHISESCPQLLPSEAGARSRAKTWMFAALNSVEPPIQFFTQLRQMGIGNENAVRQGVGHAANARLKDLAAWLGERPYLEDDFTAGDLLMTTVLRTLRGTDLLEAFPTLLAYKQRCEARDAFQRALGDQLRTFQQHEPASSH
jgi:glutathione S-transferase